MMKELIHYILEQLVDKPNLITITEIVTNDVITIKLRVDAEDRGKIIGKEGKMARALRTLIQSAALKSQKKTILEIVD